MGGGGGEQILVISPPLEIHVNVLELKGIMFKSVCVWVNLKDAVPAAHSIVGHDHYADCGKETRKLDVRCQVGNSSLWYRTHLRCHLGRNP